MRSTVAFGAGVVRRSEAQTRQQLRLDRPVLCAHPPAANGCLTNGEYFAQELWAI